VHCVEVFLLKILIFRFSKQFHRSIYVLTGHMTKIFCKAKSAGMIKRVIRWFDIVASIHDNEISVEKSKVHII
jgi:hypothetical protein